MSVNKSVTENLPESAGHEVSLQVLLDLKRQLQFHLAMGIAEYPRNEGVERFLTPGVPKREVTGRGKVQLPKEVSIPSPLPNIEEREDALDALARDLPRCTHCSFSAGRQGIICGRGKLGAALMVVGDWSRQEGNFSSNIIFGVEEDDMLWKMMAAIGLKEHEVYVTNCIKCCPGAGADPDAEAEKKCLSNLTGEIFAVRPRLICAMGDAAARVLLGTSAPLIRLRGKMGVCRYESGAPISVMPTFHPRFLLQNPEMKKAAWSDLQQVQRFLAGKRS